MKVKELIPILMDRISYFVVYDETTGQILYDGGIDKGLMPDVANAEIGIVYFRDCKGSLEHTTETICLMTAYYTLCKDANEWEEMLVCG